MLIQRIPRSNASTVLGLLEDVKAAILEEPKRANMGSFCYKSNPRYGGPACGTAGCFAGWVVMLTSGDESRDYPSWERTARQILGTDLNYRFGRNDGYHMFNAGEGDACENTVYGTLGHAKAICARIDRFIRKNGGKKALAARFIEKRKV
jgi:hypothetical protein